MYRWCHVFTANKMKTSSAHYAWRSVHNAFNCLSKQQSIVASVAHFLPPCVYSFHYVSIPIKAILQNKLATLLWNEANIFPFANFVFYSLLHTRTRIAQARNAIFSVHIFRLCCGGIFRFSLIPHTTRLQFCFLEIWGKYFHSLHFHAKHYVM